MVAFAAGVLSSLGGGIGAAGAGATVAGASAASFGAAELIGGGTAAGFSAASAGAAGGALLGALGSTSTVASILSGAATVGSVLNAQRAGDVTAQGYELNASDSETAAILAQNQGLQRRASLKAALVQALGERDVATAASGTDLSFGTPAIARRQAIADSEQALTIDQQTENAQVARLRERAASYRIMAANTRSGSLAKAAGIGITGLASVLARG